MAGITQSNPIHEGVATPTQKMEAGLKRWGLFFSLLLPVSLMLLPGFSSADEKMTGRNVPHSIKTETIEVGDVPGHIIGITQQTGLVFYSNGEIAKSTNNVSFDYVKGKGTFTYYWVITYQDGSTLLIKGGGTGTPMDGGKKTAWEGAIECIGGTGRFEGFKGTGSLKGERIGELKSGADSYVDFIMNCKKP